MPSLIWTFYRELNPPSSSLPSACLGSVLTCSFTRVVWTPLWCETAACRSVISGKRLRLPHRSERERTGMCHWGSTNPPSWLFLTRSFLSFSLCSADTQAPLGWWTDQLNVRYSCDTLHSLLRYLSPAVGLGTLDIPSARLRRSWKEMCIVVLTSLISDCQSMQWWHRKELPYLWHRIILWFITCFFLKSHSC